MNYLNYTIKRLPDLPERPAKKKTFFSRSKNRYSQTQFSELTNIPPQIVRLLIDAGRLPSEVEYHTDGRKTRYVLYDNDRWRDAKDFWRQLMADVSKALGE